MIKTGSRMHRRQCCVILRSFLIQDKQPSLPVILPLPLSLLLSLLHLSLNWSRSHQKWITMSLGVLSSSTSSITDTRLNDRTSSAPPRRQRKSTSGDSLLMSNTTELRFPLPLAKDVSGRAPPHIKQSVLDALAVYGVGQKGFASAAGKAIQVRNLDLENYGAEHGGISVVTAKAMSEVVVNEGTS